MIGVGAAIVAGFALVLPLPVAGLVPVRLLHGVAQAFFSIAIATWVMDIAEPDRRPQALGLLGIGQWGGVSLGTLTGGLVGSVAVGGAIAGATALLALPLLWLARPPATPPVSDRGPRGMVVRAVALPGVVLGLAGIGFAAATGFLVLHLPGVGTLALAAFSAMVVVGRFVSVPVAARFPLRRSLPASLLVFAAGLAAVGAGGDTWFVVTASALAGLGFCALWPLIGAHIADRVPSPQRGGAVGGASACYDIGVGVLSLAFGVVATRLGTGAVFFAAAGAVTVAAGLGHRLGRRVNRESAPLADEVAEAAPG